MGLFATPRGERGLADVPDAFRARTVTVNRPASCGPRSLREFRKGAHVLLIANEREP